MARMTCSCGELLSNSTVPNNVELFVYTGEEWDKILKFDTIETGKFLFLNMKCGNVQNAKKFMSLKLAIMKL